MLLLGFLHERRELFCRKLPAKCIQFLPHRRSDFSRTVRVMLERVEPVVIPLREHLARRSRKVRNVDVNRRRLPDPVETPDALFEQLRVFRQVEKHEVMRKLEVATLAADLRAQKDAGSILLGKVSGVPIALNQSESFMENARIHCDFPLEKLDDLLDQLSCFADEQHFFLCVLFEESRQPSYFRVELASIRQFHEMRLALREPRERRAGIAKHHAARAERVQELADESLTRPAFVEVRGDAR